MENHKEDFEWINSLKKSNRNGGFQVPENYFENLEARIQSRIANDNMPQSMGVVRDISWIRWTSFLVAASLAGVIFWNFFHQTSAETHVSLAQIEEVESEYLLGIDEYFLVENIDNSIVNELTFKQNFLTEEDILAYTEYHEFSEYLVSVNF